MNLLHGQVHGKLFRNHIDRLLIADSSGSSGNGGGSKSKGKGYTRLAGDILLEASRCVPDFVLDSKLLVPIRPLISNDEEAKEELVEGEARKVGAYRS